MRTNADKKKAVVLRSKITGETVTYESREELMKALNVSAITLYKFLRGDSSCILSRYFEVVSK